MTIKLAHIAAIVFLALLLGCTDSKSNKTGDAVQMDSSTASHFLGPRTVVYFATDIADAAKWYESVVGHGPYFNESFYVGFNVSGYELGLQPGSPPPASDSMSVAYWGVKDLSAEIARLNKLGAKTLSGKQDVGGGVFVAKLVDPFGNVIGLIENPSFPNSAQPLVK